LWRNDVHTLIWEFTTNENHVVNADQP